MPECAYMSTDTEDLYDLFLPIVPMMLGEESPQEGDV
jgi:hypothetical protein